MLTYSLAANDGEFAVYSRAPCFRQNDDLAENAREWYDVEIPCLDFRRENAWTITFATARGVDRNSHVLQLSFSRETRLGHRRWTHVERVGVWRNARRPVSPRAEFSKDCFRASSLHWFRMRLATARLLVKQIRITSSIILAVLVVTCIQHLRQ